MFHQNLMLRKCKSPVISLITGLLLRVPGRTRTVDIQNHKQSCECLINPVFIGVSAILGF